MKAIGLVLFGGSALLLSIGALLAGSAGLASAALVVAVCFVAVVYWLQTRLLQDLCLVAVCTLCAFTPFVGVPYLYAVPAVVLALFGWNSISQFSHFDSAPVSRTARRRHYIRYSVSALVPAIAITALVTIALQVRMSLSFGTAMIIIGVVGAAVIVFLRLAGKKQGRDSQE